MKEKTLYERYGHWTTVLFVVFTISIGIIGCTRTEYIEKTIINNTIEIKEIKIPCNLTCPECIYNVSTYNRTRELELIRRLKFLENQQDKYFNDSECNDELNRTENKLKDCERELCEEWNSSWC